MLFSSSAEQASCAQVEAGYTFSPLMPRFTSSGASGECLVTQVDGWEDP
jgi:hypothetical protein